VCAAVTPQELVQAACPRIGTLGAAFYFAPETLAKGKALGLDGFRFYFIGRGGVLGDVEAPVVEAAFGYFAPAVVEKMWTSAKQKIAPRAAGRAYSECAAEFGRAKFSGVAGLDAYNAAAGAIVDAADRAGLSLFAGVAAEPLAADAPARAMQLTAVLREFRGSAHLVAVLASGLSARVAHAIRRPNDVTSFGWPDAPEISEADRVGLAAADALTDRLVLGAYSAVDEAGADALLAGLTGMEAALA
jgi:hypothetical protein